MLAHQLNYYSEDTRYWLADQCLEICDIGYLLRNRPIILCDPEGRSEKRGLIGLFGSVGNERLYKIRPTELNCSRTFWKSVEIGPV